MCCGGDLGNTLSGSLSGWPNRIGRHRPRMEILIELRQLPEILIVFYSEGYRCLRDEHWRGVHGGRVKRRFQMAASGYGLGSSTRINEGVIDNDNSGNFSWILRGV